MDNHRLSRLPFLLALIVAVAQMPLQIFTFNQREIGTAHATPWRRRLGAAIRQRASSLWTQLLASMRAPDWRWQVGLALVALLVLALTSDHALRGGLAMAMGLTTTEMRADRKKLVDQADEIHKKAIAEKREMSGDEEAKFDQIHADADVLLKKIEREERHADAMASLDATQGRRSEPKQPASESRGRQADNVAVQNEDRLEGMRSWFLAGSDQERTPEMRAAAAKVGLNLEQRSMTLRLPRVGLKSSSLRSPSAEDLKDWQERAAMGTTSGAVGAYTVPNEAMRPLEIALLAFGGMRSVATVIRTDSGASLPLPTSNDSSNKGAILTENIAASEVDVTFGQLTLDAYKYSSKYLLISVELLQDSAVNVAEWIGRALGERIGRITNDHFTTGTGSSQPNGIVAAAAAGVTATGLTGTTTYDLLVDLVHSVDPAYRDNGKFMFHDGGLKMLKKIKVLQYSGDTTGVPLWSPGLAPGAPDTVLSYPYVVNQSMTTPATGVKSILFGDFSKYIIRDVRDITLLRLDERFAEYHQVAYLAFSRHDGDLLDAGTNPVKYHLQG